MKRIKLTAPKNNIKANILLPSSKSISNRALIISSLANGCGQPENLSDCDDTRVMLRALKEMSPAIDILAAGTAMRFLTAYLSVSQETHILTGTERMKQRPIRILVDALRSLGADITYTENEGYPPLRVTGTRLQGGKISLPGNVSSQYISALLMIAPILEEGMELTLTGDVVSRPYIDLTLRMMREYGARCEWKSENRLYVEPQPYQSVTYRVESDWSAASYWYEIAALSEEAEIELPGLKQDSGQGDAKVAKIFKLLGVTTLYNQQGVTIKKSGDAVKRIEYDFVNQPDLAQTVVVTCVMAGIHFRFSGLQSLKIKETDRMAALTAEMKKLGYVLSEENGSVLSWNGERCEAQPHPAIDTYEDHRMAMAFAPAILRCDGLSINNPEVVSKSYPNYWNNLLNAGFGITEE